jgi:RNA-binding protein
MDELPTDRVQELRGEAQELSAELQVGKAGLSDGFVDEVDRQLAREDLVKLRVLRSAAAENGPEATGEELAERLDAHLIEVRGNTVVLYRD